MERVMRCLEPFACSRTHEGSPAFVQKQKLCLRPGFAAREELCFVIVRVLGTFARFHAVKIGCWMRGPSSSSKVAAPQSAGP